MKRIAVKKSELDKTIRELTSRMTNVNWFLNIQTKHHKDPDKVWLIIG